MNPEELLRALYMREMPILQTNDWANLRIPVADLIAAHPLVPAADIIALLRSLRLDGKLMFLPDWKRWGVYEDETDGSIESSLRQWEPGPGDSDPPTWSRRKAFIPNDLSGWYVRSRVAESARLLFANRERFGLEAATAHLGYELQARFRPDRTSAPILDVVARLQRLVDGGVFPRAADPDALKHAIGIVGAGLQGLNHPTIAAFQERAWESILRSLFAQPRDHDATMITAGVSSGKTFAFLLPTLTLVAYRALCGQGRRNRALVIYPRTSLVEDQFHNLRDLLAAINTHLAAHRPGLTLADRAALDAGQMLTESLEVDATSLADTLPQVGALGIEIILTTPESLKNRMLDPRAVRTYLNEVEVVVFDEIHLMEGLAGCHGIYFIRRLRQLLRDLRQDRNFEPAWVGASATVAEPVEHCARVLSLHPSRVVHVEPHSSELVRFGTFHHLFLHTRVGKPSISAVTNGISCLVHTRNDCTAFNHYVDPSAATLQPRLSEDIPKTIAFVDSLSTIGRLRFTTADNERTYKPFSSSPPYYSWFFRPAARFGATSGEVKAITESHLTAVRDWCQKCYHGIPARMDSSPLKNPVYSFLRTSTQMDQGAKTRSTPPGFTSALQALPDTVENLDRCPFHEHRLCWWFSQDAGQRRTIGNGSLPIDQNRAIAYTSKTDEPDEGLHENVNDYFVTTSRRLWEDRDSGIPNRPEAVSMLLASPRIEVGVDFKKVRDGATHKALRSAASFQQKVGRVGREDDSDSMVVTFLAHRPTDAHFAHQPARLIDAAHLDPIPLKSENPDVLRSHMFVAGLEFIASRAPGTIPNAGHELNIIGTGSDRVPESWEAKVRACLTFLTAQGPTVRAFMLAATRQPTSEATIADGALAQLRELLETFVVDLSGAYAAGGTPAHWFKLNHQVVPTPAFTTLLDDIQHVIEALQRASVSSPPIPQILTPAIAALASATSSPTPNAASIQSAATALFNSTGLAMSSGLTAAAGMDIFGAVNRAQTIATTLPTLSFPAPLPRLRRGHSIVQAFFEQTDQGRRTQQQYYLHDILTRLLPFREFYPYGLVRTHFQHVNARQVRVLYNGDEDERESLSTALGELLPGTWNYRWVQPRKSKCGPINVLGGTGEHFANLSNIEGPNRAAFEPTGSTLGPMELPADMPTPPAGTIVPILRPTRLWTVFSFNRPDARFDNQLIGDDDESGRIDDMELKASCPTVPRSFPATWYRVEHGSMSRSVVGEGDPGTSTPLTHTFPAVGRVLFDRVTFSSEMRTDRYVYAIDRSYGAGGIDSPRIHYRYGANPQPIVLGDRLNNTDGLTFYLKPATVTALLNSALSSGAVRGEMTLRALRRFIARAGGCGPFRVEMIRKVLLMDYLDGGGTLAQLDATAIQAVISGMTPVRYDQLSQRLIDGLFAGADHAETVRARVRQTGWYQEAWVDVLAVQSVAGTFTTQFVSDVARDILVHTLAVTALDGVSRLVGAADGDLSYFHRADLGEIYIFDSVEGGNGYAETIERFLHIPPLRRVLAMRGGASTSLPSADGFVLIEEALAACNAQSATRLLVETCRRRVPDPAHLRFPRGLVSDLQARIRHEYDHVAGARAIVDHLLQAEPTLFADWPDLLWLQLVPERFATSLVAAGVCANLESLRSRTHLCVTGCIECVDNGDQSIFGLLASREHVSKNLLDLARKYVVASEPQAFLEIPGGTAIGPALQATSGRPVTDAAGSPVTVVVNEDGAPRQVLLSQVRSTVLPDLSIAGSRPLLSPTVGGLTWDVNVPYLAGYRDERPTP